MHDPAFQQRVRHPSLQFPADKRAVLAATVQRICRHPPVGLRVENADIGHRTHAQMTAVQSQYPRRSPGQSLDQRQQRQSACASRKLSPNSVSSPETPGSVSANGACLASGSCG